MHKCARCSREIQTLEEVNTGCPCGSKIFVFDRGVAETAKPIEPVAAPPPFQARPLAQAEASEEKKEEGHAPESYFARTTFTTEDVENIKIVSDGVFLVDVNALAKNPVVLKDDEGVYFVKIPLEQNGQWDTLGEKDGKSAPQKEKGQKE
jgi:predicted  nucleic acid-binding Zn-ribbon protein